MGKGGGRGHNKARGVQVQIKQKNIHKESEGLTFSTPSLNPSTFFPNEAFRSPTHKYVMNTIVY